MKIPTARDVKNYLYERNPAGLRGATVTRDLTAKRANNHFNWVIRKGNRHFVVRMAKPKGNVTPNIRMEFAVLKHLKNTGVAPRPWWLDTNHFAYPLLIEDFVAGKLPGNKLRGKELRAIARTVARLHRLTIPNHLKLEDKNYATRLEILEKRLAEATRKPLISRVAQEIGISSLRPRLKKFFKLAVKLADKKRRVFLHGDLYLGNVIIGKRGAVLIDFQKPATGDPTCDLGNLFVGIAWRPHYENSRDILVKEYLHHNNYPQLKELLDVRMIERDITSIVSELRDAAHLPQRKSTLKRYFHHKRPKWRMRLIKRGLDSLGV